jgi:hypothetical protein
MSSPALQPQAAPMGWMDAHEYLLMEQAVHDRLDDAQRFSLEQAFHSEPADGIATARGPAARRACGGLWPDRCAQHV